MFRGFDPCRHHHALAEAIVTLEDLDRQQSALRRHHHALAEAIVTRLGAMPIGYVKGSPSPRPGGGDCH